MNDLHQSLPSQADVIPDQLVFPPFLSVPPIINLKPISKWNDYGLWLPKTVRTDETDQASTFQASPCDSTNTPLISVGHPFAGLSFEEKEEARRSKRREADHRKKDAAGRPGFRVAKEECWLIGHDPNWKEPEGSSKSDYDEAIPPFSRLLSATRDFEYSRQAEFQFTRSKRLFQLIRNAFGLRSSFQGRHWSGSGPHGYEYIAPTSHASRGNEYAPFETDSGPDVDEVCILLTDPETCVRGLLALARREAEAGWDFEPAHKFTVITAAFLSFLVHYDVLPEPALQASLRKACDIAHSAPQALLDAKALEDVLSSGTGWNRANWTMFGGSWGGAERGGLEKSSISWGKQNANQEPSEGVADDGGWSVSKIFDDRPVALTKEEAPWTAKEKWRTHNRINTDDSYDDEEYSANDDSNPLDQEVATVDKPDRLIIWVEDLGEDPSLVDKMVGMGLRGRWGLMGYKNGSESDFTQWWAFKAKDCE
ncbi:hypothetical protein I204_04447 [Kwoniella mangroviensis CBS 8886]|nr:hypothetical protein I204_04447 [Kwoniella mangroviensis CBS 8886]